MRPLIILSLGLLIFIVVRCEPANVSVENDNVMAVALELDGRPWLTLERGETLWEQVPQGTHELVVRREGTREELDRRTIAVEQERYILNVLGAQTYYEGRVCYRIHAFEDCFSQEYSREVNGVWIEIPSDVDYLFWEPPETISVPRANHQREEEDNTRSYLTREPVSE